MYDIPRWVHILLALSAFVYVYYTVTTKTPLMFPTQQAAIDVMINLIKAEKCEHSNKSIKIYDLGAGAGGMALKLAKAFPQATVVGVEIAWPAWLYSWIRQKISKLGNVHFILSDFMKINVADGDVVLFYMTDASIGQMSKKLAKEGKKGSLIISNTFPLAEPWIPLEDIPVQASVSKKIIAYRA
jgi:SAM-dependent methyltransferase